MAYIQGQKYSSILYIVTNCNIIVSMTVCIYRYIHAKTLYYRGRNKGIVCVFEKWW